MSHTENSNENKTHYVSDPCPDNSSRSTPLHGPSPFPVRNRCETHWIFEFKVVRPDERGKIEISGSSRRTVSRETTIRITSIVTSDESCSFVSVWESENLLNGKRAKFIGRRHSNPSVFQRRVLEGHGKRTIASSTLYSLID